MLRVRFGELPFFSHFDQYNFDHLFFEDDKAAAFYVTFRNRIFEALGKRKYLPVMRMCDGEYIFCVGKKRGYRQKGIKALKYYAGRLFKRNTTVWGEAYTREQDKLLKRQFPELLKEIAAHGFIANHFLYSEAHFCEEYIAPMQQWFAENAIHLTHTNYTAFYFVYVLLNGPDSLQLFSNRNVLVLSSFNREKCNAVEKELKRRGAATVYFNAISPTQSMLDKPDLSSYKNKVDISLVAGGIGSANLLLQCKPLNIVCIDSGFCLECLANPARRKERIYCLPDEEF